MGVPGYTVHLLICWYSNQTVWSGSLMYADVLVIFPHLYQDYLNLCKCVGHMGRTMILNTTTRKVPF